MDVSDASYYIFIEKENKGSQKGHTKKIFKKKLLSLIIIQLLKPGSDYNFPKQSCLATKVDIYGFLTRIFPTIKNIYQGLLVVAISELIKV
jgi:hypothetical protein